MSKRIRVLWLVWMVGMLALGAWSLFPAARTAVDLPLNPLILSNAERIDLEGRRLRFDLPAFLRVGEELDLRFEITAGDQPEDAELTAAARLELPGLVGEPVELREKMFKGQPARFVWPVKVSEPGTQRGLLWLTIFVKQAGKPVEEVAVLARPIEVPVRSVLALQVASPAGLAIGLVAWVLRRRLLR